MKSQFQALIVIAIAFGALGGILIIRAQSNTSCPCGTPVGFPPGCVIAPCPAHEMLVMESYKINSPTNATLTILNNGELTVNFWYYNVSQSNGATFTHANWTEPMLAPNQAFDANILIAGAPFTFQSGSSYTITVVTTRNIAFHFTVNG